MPLFGHQGGWDEIAYFLVPALAVIAWVRWAEKRAKARRAAEEDGETGEDHPEGGDRGR